MHDWTQVGFWPTDKPENEYGNVWHCKKCGYGARQKEMPNPDATFQFSIDYRAGIGAQLNCEEIIVWRVMNT